MFGCVSYIHTNSITRSKFHPKTKKFGFFYWYGDIEFGNHF